MPRPNNKSDKNGAADNGEIEIRRERSSLAEFTSRPLPTEKEVERFEEFIEEEAKGEEIEESLSEIYQDDNGEMVDVRRMVIKRRHGFLFWFFVFVFLMSVFAGAGYAVYRYVYLHAGSDATAFEFYIDGETDITAGEELTYVIHYKNTSNIPIRNARLNVAYPENFLFAESRPAPSSRKDIWLIDAIPAKYSGKVTISGSIIGQKGDTGIMLANMTYAPENFSSEFRKETSINSTIRDVGLFFDFNYTSTVLLGEESEVGVRIRAGENSRIDNFRLVFEPQENIDFLPSKKDAKDEKNEGGAGIEVIRPGVWQISGVTGEESILPARFKFTEKISDHQEITLNFYAPAREDASTSSAESRQIKIFEKKIAFEVMKSDLNLTLIINGAREDQPVNFGQRLNYSIVYKNKGEAEMKNVVIMAALESDFLDWTTLKFARPGRERGNTISWSKEEMPELEALARNEEGIIDFSIEVAGMGEPDYKKNYQVRSFAQFSVGEKEGAPAGDDNKSNTIINKINSDLRLTEQVRYFNEDNIPVGTGPHPPAAGETTTYKVYWDLSNNLHELHGLKVTVKLPEYADWDGKERASVGSVRFSGENREIVWDIGRLPVTVYRAGAEFS